MDKNEKNHRTALLVMDIQNAITAHIQNPENLLSNINKAVKAAHESGVKVIYVRLGFREGHPEIDSRHPRFGALKESKIMFTESHEGTSFHPDITLEANDIVVVKKRVSAFAGSDLDIILRAHRIEFLILSGISTTGVVLGTLREAADKDYRVTVLTDACADPDPEVHEFLVNKIFPFSGETITTNEWTHNIQL